MHTTLQIYSWVSHIVWFPLPSEALYPCGYKNACQPLTLAVLSPAETWSIVGKEEDAGLQGVQACVLFESVPRDHNV